MKLSSKVGHVVGEKGFFYTEKERRGGKQSVINEMTIQL